jgi:la-related protein 1
MNMNGFTPGASQHIAVHSKENLSNGTAAEGINGTVIPDGHSVDNATNAVSGEPDSFSDEQIEGLTVIVRKQDQSLLPALLPATIRTFSNGTLDSRSGVPDEPETSGRQASVKANGTGPSSG